MSNGCNPKLVSFCSVVVFEMKFTRLLLLSFFALSLMCFTAILLLPRIKEKNFLSLPSETLSRYASKLAVTIYRNSPGLPQSVAKKKTNRRTEWSLASFEAPWNETSGRANVSHVDLEFQKLLNDTKTQEEEIEGYSDPADSGQAIIQYDELSCTPQNSVAFLKTHKTGSSTLTNILNRYADLREFRLALPAKYFYRFGWPSYFHWSAVDLWRLNGQPANVLCNHARYNRIEMDLIMDNSTKYITILRDPVYQFESTFNYMELYRFFKLENFSNPMEVFLANPGGYLRNLSKPGKPFPESMYLVRNGMFFDLGLPPSYQDNETEIRKAIKRLEDDFSLVLMMEYFDESLVLLKREFCWDLDDVAYIKQNQRKSEKSTSKPVLSSWMKEMIRKWNHADVLLYDYFNKTFWERIKRHGPDFYRDLADLKRKNREMYKDCVSPEEVTETAFRLTGKIRGFKLNEGVSRFNRYLCEKLLTNEIEYINYFRQKLHPNAEYQKQLRAKGRAMAPAENIIAKRIRAAKGLIKVVSRVSSGRVRTS